MDSDATVLNPTKKTKRPLNDLDSVLPTGLGRLRVFWYRELASVRFGRLVVSFGQTVVRNRLTFSSKLTTNQRGPSHMAVGCCLKTCLLLFRACLVFVIVFLIVHVTMVVNLIFESDAA